MSTKSSFSFSSFTKYGNECINSKTDIGDAFKTDLKKAIAHAGYPSKDEIGIVDEINDFDMSATIATIPSMVAGYMKSTDRGFDIPAADNKTCAASVKVASIPDKEKTFTIMLGNKKGEQGTSFISAHDEYTVKNRRDPFKKK